MVTLNETEIQEMRDEIAAGKLPADAIKKHLEDEAKNVFGIDAKKVGGKYQEQGLGSKGNETRGHFDALLNAERRGQEEVGTWQKAVNDIWRRDPDRAAKLNLPRPKA